MCNNNLDTKKSFKVKQKLRVHKFYRNQNCDILKK